MDMMIAKCDGTRFSLLCCKITFHEVSVSLEFQYLLFYLFFTMMINIVGMIA